jgi:thiol-disulfide isomerase/thioredoxin
LHSIPKFTIEPKWFAPKYEKYELDESAVSSLKNIISADISFKVFFGTWCGDSQKELPRFLKVTDQLNLADNQLGIFATDNSTERYKQSAKREEKGLTVYRVPTFIVYKKGKEIGKITEHPKESLEADLVKIIGGEDYTANYAGVMDFEAVLQKKGEKYISKNQVKLAKQFKELTSKGSELSSYAMIKFANGENELAMSILEINSLMYPDYSGNQYRIAKIQRKMGNDKKAIALLEDFVEKNLNSISVRMLLREMKS